VRTGDIRGRPAYNTRYAHDQRREKDPTVTDVLFLAILVAFFAIAVLFVHACERIIGPDLEAEHAGETATPDGSQGPEADQVAA
jgi:hypothetical protein